MTMGLGKSEGRYYCRVSLDKYQTVLHERYRPLFLFYTFTKTFKAIPHNRSFNMAMSQAAWKAEQALGHGDNATTAQDVTNPGNKPEWGNPSETMKALAWMGKNKVEVGKQRNQPSMRHAVPYI
jgi:hypothetical protein